MKLTEIKKIINEMPYQHSGEMKREPNGSSFISSGTLSRSYKQSGFIEALQDTMVELHILNDTVPSVIGTISAVKPNGLQSNEIVFALRFKSKHTLLNVPEKLKSSLIIQVDKVSIKKEFEGQGIASFAYSQIAKLGIVVLSDTSQFTDGRKLWEKMAKEAHLNSYKIFILDDEYGFKEKDGEPISYSGGNINADQIWSSGENYSKEHIVLAMI